MNLRPGTFESFRDSLPERPDSLLKKGYERFDENTTDPSRWVWFRKRRETLDGQHVLEVQIRYELTIGDAVGVSYVQNRDYSFNDVEISLARIEPAQELVRVPICPRSLRELENLVSVFCPYFDGGQTKL